MIEEWPIFACISRIGAPFAVPRDAKVCRLMCGVLLLEYFPQLHERWGGKEHMAFEEVAPSTDVLSGYNEVGKAGADAVIQKNYEAKALLKAEKEAAAKVKRTEAVNSTKSTTTPKKPVLDLSLFLR